MRIKLIAMLFLISLFSYCNGQEVSKGDYLIKKLEKAENSRDIQLIESLLAEDVALFSPNMPPVNGKAAIVSIYNFVFSRPEKQSAEYRVDSIYKDGNKHVELGINTTKKLGQVADINKFKVVFKQMGKEYKIVEIYFGKEEDIKRDVPILLTPTGKYKVGQSTHFYDKSNSGNNRLLSFQIWYPTQTKSDLKAVYQSKEVVEASANFLGFPIFAVSYFSLIETNSYLNATVLLNKQFPILLYNHGYGGFTSVYQTVFEDLASHGYIVVSIGHENESALLIKENGDVISNTPQNDFYSKRLPELNGSEIGRWQSEILNSNEFSKNDIAYKEMLKLTPLHNESTRFWQSDTETTIEKLGQINTFDKNLKGIFNFEQIGIFGHSLGGATAGQMCFGKTLIKAGINLDGFQFGDLYQNKLRVPFMFVSSNQEQDRYLRALTYIENSEKDCFQVTIKGFSHDNFTDLKYIMEGDKEAMKLQRALIKSFFDKYLKNKKVNLNKLEEEYKKIKFSASNISN